MSSKQFHLPAIPDGFQIYEERLEVAGLAYRKRHALRFVRGREHRLEFEPEPSNRFDPNAIRVIGLWRGWFRARRALIGYVPKDVAAAIQETGFVDAVVPRLLKTFEGSSGFVEVQFQVLGPKGRKKEYQQARWY